MEHQLLADYYSTDKGNRYRFEYELNKMLYDKYVRNSLTPEQTDRYIEFLHYFDWELKSSLKIKLSINHTQTEVLNCESTDELNNILANDEHIEDLIANRSFTIRDQNWKLNDVISARVCAKKFRLRPDYVGDITNLNTWSLVPFYMESKFITLTNVITFYDDYEQTTFNVLTYHDFDSTPLQIEKNILAEILSNILTHTDSITRNCTIGHLSMISTFNYWTEKYEEKEREKIITASERNRGKWFFQPDQKCHVVKELLEDFDGQFSGVAQHTRPFSELITSKEENQ